MEEEEKKERNFVTLQATLGSTGKLCRQYQALNKAPYPFRSIHRRNISLQHLHQEKKSFSDSGREEINCAVALYLARHLLREISP